MALLLTSDDLARCLRMEDAIAAVEASLAERAGQTLVSPLRTSWPVGRSALTITPGGLEKMGILGFRVYLRARVPDQLTAVWNLQDGSLEGIIRGPELGAIRTGAIGGLAVKWMAARDARRVGIIGGGLQSRMQLRAVRVVRPSVTEVRIYRRDAARRSETARSWRGETGLDVRAVDSEEEAVRQSEVVILATGSEEPVIESKWLAPGSHVNSLGPKDRGHSEIGMDLLEGADWIVSDFPELYRSEPDFLLAGTPLLSKLQDLATLIAAAPARPPGLRTVFLSHGLSGTEVAVAHRALVRAASLGLGTPIPGAVRSEGP